MSTLKEIWIFAECGEHGAADVTLELLGEGLQLAEKSGFALGAVLLTDQPRPEVEQDLIKHGAKKVYRITDEKLTDYQNDFYAQALKQLIEKQRPEIMLFGATDIGRCLAPTVAALTETGLTADCTALDFDSEMELLIQTRPAFGGNIMASIICPEHRPQMATVRAHVFSKAPLQDNQGEVIEVAVDLSGRKNRLRKVESIKLQDKGVNLHAANYIVSGGRGLGAKENFDLIRNLAEEFGGAVGASRPVIDMGWIEHHHQVGQTGNTVSPTVYIACGISGAIQHLAGMQTSDVIIAVNKDPDAPIFDVADYQLVGDLHDIVPALTEQLRSLKSES
ncbi:electron transfer flavoprotein subunit alpha/FixB family protein [Verrucomicrobiota bacterium]